MLPPIRRRPVALLTALLLIVGGVAGAGGQPQPARSTNNRLARAIGQGYVRSATFRRMVEALRATDVIVYVESGDCDCRRANACLSLSAASGGVRYLRASVSLRRLDLELIEQIGHELQHALEIARQAEIISDATLAAYYRTHSQGCGRLAHCFETAAARAAGNAVRTELYHHAK